MIFSASFWDSFADSSLFFEIHPYPFFSRHLYPSQIRYLVCVSDQKLSCLFNFFQYGIVVLVSVRFITLCGKYISTLSHKGVLNISTKVPCFLTSPWGLVMHLLGLWRDVTF